MLSSLSSLLEKRPFAAVLRSRVFILENHGRTALPATSAITRPDRDQNADAGVRPDGTISTSQVRWKSWWLSLAAFVLVSASLSRPAFASETKRTSFAGDFSVPSACYWAPTGIMLKAGQAYRIEVVNMKDVRDASVRVGNLEGWPNSWTRVLLSPLFWTRRRPFEPWFALIATVECREPRRLREGKTYVAPASGRLVCYFNDAWFAYGNNHGTAKLRLVLAGPPSSGRSRRTQP